MMKEDIAAAVSNISDKYLMEAMGSITDTVTQNPDEVINMNMQKHFTLKRVVAFAIAACLILALGITVYATNDSFERWFKGVFSGPPAQEETYKQICANSMIPCTSNGTTITPIAAIADNAICYIRLKIDAPEGTVLNIPNEDNGYLQLDNGSFDLLVNKETNKTEPGTIDLCWEDATPDDNSIDVVIIFHGETGLTHFNDGKVRAVNIHNIWLQDKYKKYSVVLVGDWSFDVVFPEGTFKELDVKGLEVHSPINNEISDTIGESITLTQMRISPLSLEVSYHFTTQEDATIPGPETIVIVMNDGNEITCSSGGGEDGIDWSNQVYVLDTPIVVDNVDHIQFGSQQISMN